MRVDRAAWLRLTARMNAGLPPIPDIDTARRIAAQMQQAALEEPRLGGAAPDSVLRLVKDKRAILRGQLEGRSVVFRLHLDPEQGAAGREWAEMQRLWPHMNSGNLRIPEPICAAPRAGVVVQEAVSGAPLMELMYGLDARDRLVHLPRAAAWLHRSTGISEAWQAPSPARWIERAARATANQPFDALRAIEAQILERMKAMAPAIEAAPWRVAICHGDYHPNNLISCGDRLTGIDLGGSRRLPVMKDVARFAMHMGRRRMRLSGRVVLGVDAACIEAFTEGLSLTPLERSHVLPFFIGFEALIRTETPALPEARIRRAQKAYAALLADLQTIPT